MSCYEWEAGTIKLPSAEFAKVKKAVEEADRAHKERLFAQTQAFWKLLPSRAKNNLETYHKWVRAFVWGNTPAERWNYQEALPQMRAAAVGRDEPYELQHLLEWVAVRTETVVEKFGGKFTEWVENKRPRRILQKDMLYPTNRTTVFHCGEPHISFDPKARTVHWEVPENNHARDYAREHPVAKALFRALKTVRWTRGSGGEIIGNDEYNRDSGHEYAGGGGSYILDEFGPPRKSTGRRLAYR